MQRREQYYRQKYSFLSSFIGIFYLEEPVGWVEAWSIGTAPPIHQSHPMPRGTNISTIPRESWEYPRGLMTDIDMIGDGSTEQVLPAQVGTGCDTGCWALVVDTCAPRRDAGSTDNRCSWLSWWTLVALIHSVTLQNNSSGITVEEQ